MTHFLVWSSGTLGRYRPTWASISPTKLSTNLILSVQGYYCYNFCTGVLLGNIFTPSCFKIIGHRFTWVVCRSGTGRYIYQMAWNVGLMSGPKASPSGLRFLRSGRVLCEDVIVQTLYQYHAVPCYLYGTNAYYCVIGVLFVQWRDLHGSFELFTPSSTNRFREVDHIDQWCCKGLRQCEVPEIDYIICIVDIRVHVWKEKSFNSFKTGDMYLYQ